MAPVAAAAIGLDGNSDVSHAESVWACPPAASCPAASAAPAGSGGAATPRGGRRRKSAGPNGMTTAAVPVSKATNTRRVRPPSLPIDFTSLAEATPVMRSETTSGITVMRMALTHSVPTGAMASAACRNEALPDAAIAAPPATATQSATRTRVLSFIAETSHAAAIAPRATTVRTVPMARDKAAARIQNPAGTAPPPVSCLQRLCQIFDQILRMLEADRHTKEVLRSRRALAFARGAMFDEGLRSAQ